ncbi:MAG: aminoacetone oxidase family FAD-binding enzyme, partial [Clostridia bacterium]
MKKFDFAIIGAGASGLMAAVKLSEKGKKVAVLDGNAKIGKKLLATGNGKCNLCNRNIQRDFFHGDVDLIENILKENSCSNIEHEFHKIGIMTTADEQGRVYPKSFQAQAVVKAFSDVLLENNVEVFLNFKAVNAKKENGFFTVFSENSQKIICKNLIIASGSKASSKHGCGDEIFEIIKSFGHSLTELSPALVSFKISDKFLKNLSGVRSKVTAKLICENKEIYGESGEIIFSEKGISGICIFNLSSYIKRGKKHKLLIDLMPEMDENKVFSDILSITKNRPSMRVSELLNGIINMKLGFSIVRKIGLNIDKTADTLSKNDIQNISKTLKNLSFNIEDLGDFDSA